MKFTFNTGRGYQPKGHKFAGQVIDVEATTDGVTYTVKFWDRSRLVDGAFTTPDWTEDYGTAYYTPERFIREAVMRHYDENKYVAVDYFDYLRRLEHDGKVQP